MSSFIELPRLTYQGRDRTSLYINTDDIVCFGDTDSVGQINVTVRELGSEGVGIIQTYAPLDSLLLYLAVLAHQPGVHSWSQDTKDAWAQPVSDKLAEAYRRERAEVR